MSQGMFVELELGVCMMMDALSPLLEVWGQLLRGSFLWVGGGDD